MNKTLKTVLIVLGVVAVLAAIAWFLYRRFRKQVDSVNAEFDDEVSELENESPVECNIVQKC